MPCRNLRSEARWLVTWHRVQRARRSLRTLASTATTLLGQLAAGREIDACRVQDPSDEFALGVGVGVPVLAVPTAETVLQPGVVGAKAWIGAQGVPEGDQRAGVRLVVLDQLQVVGACLPAGAAGTTGR